jgi:serine/threonine protein kinase
MTMRMRRYFHQLLDGIAYCHGRKICHGDIKPENLCLDSSAVLKIVDFGLCHELGSSTRRGDGGRGGGGGGGSGWSSAGSGGGSHINSGCYTAPEIHSQPPSRCEDHRRSARPDRSLGLAPPLCSVCSVLVAGTEEAERDDHDLGSAGTWIGSWRTCGRAVWCST